MKSYDEFIDDVVLYSLKVDKRNLDKNFKYANGCGSKGGIKFPKTMWGINIESACIIHDIEWQQSQSFSELLLANENFDNNLKLITDINSLNDFTRWIRRMRIAKYVSGVELRGTRNYSIERGFP